jgi:hypothetical protein
VQIENMKQMMWMEQGEPVQITGRQQNDEEEGPQQ